MKKVILLSVIMGVLIVVSCSKKSTESGPSKPRWTVIGYMDGNNNLDISNNNTSYVIQDVQDLEAVGSTDEVKIVVAVGSMKKGGIVKYYEVQHFTNELPDSLSSPVLQNLGTKDMSDKQTLIDFLNYVKEHYSADHYLLILDDHGGGWKGCCSDEVNGAGDLMDMVSLRQAIEQSGLHIDIVVFHACLMSMAEVAYELKDIVDYVVASEFSMPMQSVLNPQKWLQDLVNNPGMDPSELAKDIAQAVYEEGVRQGKTVHMAAIKESGLLAFGAKLGLLANRLVTQTGQYAGEIYDAWGHTHVSNLDEPNFVDLREFVKNLKNEPHLGQIPTVREAIDSLIDAINKTVLITFTNAQMTRGGLTIYLPINHSTFAQDSAAYVKLKFTETNWYSFVSKFSVSGGGGQTQLSGTVTWPGHNLSNNCIVIVDTSHSQYIIPLTTGPVNPANGSFSLNLNITQPIEAYIEAWDDVNGNGSMDSGDGVGWWDVNQNGQWDDMIVIHPGDNLQNIVIELQELSKRNFKKLKF